MELHLELTQLTHGQDIQCESGFEKFRSNWLQQFASIGTEGKNNSKN